MEKDVAVAKARKPANQAHMLAAEEEKGAVKLEEPNEHDVENTMDSEPDLADEPDDDELDMPNAGNGPEKLAEPRALFNVISFGAQHGEGIRMCCYISSTPFPFLPNQQY